MNLFKRALTIVLAAGLSTSALADEAQIRKALTEAMPKLTINKIEKSQIQGLYAVDVSGQTLFTSSDGAFFVAGELYSVAGGSLVNLSEVEREHARADQLASIKPEERIVFPAKGETKARIAVFTDIDCGYCRKLHKEVPSLNDMGVEVSYLAYPRAGIGSESYNKIVSAWCSDDQLKALTEAKMGHEIPKLSCDNPVAAQFKMGQEMGVSGTPAILLEDGEMVPGYVPADRLAKKLGIL